MKVLVTGGTGFIGSHTVVELLSAGHEPVIVDNFCNSKKEVAGRLEKIVNHKIKVIEADLCDKAKVDQIFTSEQFDAVIHFAALKAVGESVEKPLLYYKNNLLSLINVLDATKENSINKFIFSSSSTVYGLPDKVPITENQSIKATNPYGSTKIMGEQIVRDTFSSSGTAILLRYFNPIGAHESGLIGEDPNGVPNNLLPYVAKVAVGELPELTIHGNDYDTPDGTGVRDYIHVVDLAKGHVKALDKNTDGIFTYNLGTGKGYSVLEIIKAFELASGKKVPYEIGPRRPGDIGECYADASLANKELGWIAEKNINDMCRDAWKWQQYISSSSN